MAKKYKNLQELEKNHDDLGRFVKGNVVREKWTKLKTHRKLNQMIQLLNDDDNYKTNVDGEQVKVPYTYCIIQHLVVKAGVTDMWLYDIERKFKDDDEIQDLIGQIKNTLEGRIWTSTSMNLINPNLGMFTLRAYHNKIERQFIKTENENTNTYDGEINLNIIYPTKKEE